MFLWLSVEIALTLTAFGITKFDKFKRDEP
jgi:hypothetical protein